MKQETKKEIKQNIIGYGGILNEFNQFEQSMKLFKDIRTIFVPKNVEGLLRAKRMDKELVKIHKDKLLAIEYCLVFLSNFNYINIDENNKEKWKTLYSKVLIEQIPGSEGRYKRVIELLSSPIFPSSSLIEPKLNKRGTPTYEAGAKSKEYRLSNKYSRTEYTKYIITSEILIKQRQKVQYRNMKDITTNTIAKNLLTIYPKITLPTSEEISAEAKRLVKEKYYNNKGKKLTILNGRKKSDLKDFNNRISYDDSLKNYKFLTDNGLTVPIISGKKAGGRVYDSFNMMPSFIRNLITIDNENVVNVDLKCLHPNLSIKLYNGNSKFLTHQSIAAQLKLDVKDVKIAHLSFFNMNVKQMGQSPLFEYYQNIEPDMLKNLIDDKDTNGYKITSQKMFDLEVKIMSELIRRLNEMGIYPLYIFDALLVKDSDQNTVEYTMNKVVEEMGIYTIVGSDKSTSFIRMAMNKEKQSSKEIVVSI
jgi:hypothetical protein